MASSSSTQIDNLNEDDLIKNITEQWNQLNKTLEKFPKFQNKNQTGVNEEHIKEFESKLNINLPKEIRTVIKVHNGRKHIDYGLGYRLPTTDLLPISQWKSYEKENDNFVEDLLQCLIDENNSSINKNLYDDFREHLHVYREIIEKDKKENKNLKIINNKTFQSLPCELVIIGQGMDDYAEQYLLSIRSGRIYLAVHNIPEWRLIGTFYDWIKMGLKSIEEQNYELNEQHKEIEIS